MAKNAKVRTVKAWAVVAEGERFYPTGDVRDSERQAKKTCRVRNFYGDRKENRYHPVPITITFAARREGRK